MGWKVGGSIHGRVKWFSIYTTPRPPLGPTQPPTEWILEAPPQG